MGSGLWQEAGRRSSYTEGVGRIVVLLQIRRLGSGVTGGLRTVLVRLTIGVRSNDTMRDMRWGWGAFMGMFDVRGW